MRHKKHIFKIGKSGSHRKAMFGNMLCSLFEHGRIKCTITKAKELRKFADKMISAAKNGGLHKRRQAISTMRSPEAVTHLFDEIGPRYTDRPGGYTRIIRIGKRLGDGSELCFIELVGEGYSPSKKVKTTSAAAETIVEEVAVPETEVAETIVEEAPEEEIIAEETETVVEDAEISEEPKAKSEDQEKKED